MKFQSVSKKAVLVAAIAGAAGTQAFAGITASTYSGTTFQGTPTIDTDPTPTANTSNGYFQLGSGTSDIVSQVVTPATTFTLGEIDVLLAGAPNHNVSLHIFPVASGGTGTTTYVTPGTPDLLNPSDSAGSEQLFNFYGTGSTTFESLVLTGAQQVTLNAGTAYDVEFWSDQPATAGDGTAYFPNTASAVYAGGNAYQGKGDAGYTQVASGQYRGNVSGNQDIALALYAATPVPEPTSLGALGIGAASLLLRKRR